MARRIEVEIIGNAASLERAFGRAQTRGNRFESALRRVGRAAIYAGTALAAGAVVGLEKSVHAAVDAEASQARLAQAFKDAHLSLQPYLGSLDKVESASRRLGFTDTEVREALGSLIVATGNYRKATADLSVAQDLARFKHIQLADATKMLTMAMTGSQRAAKQLGIVVIPTSAAVDRLKRSHVDLTTATGKALLAQAKLQDKLALGQAVIDQVTAKTRGQSKAFADTAAGGLAQFRAQFEHLEVTLGRIFLPALVTVMDKASTAVEALSRVVSAHMPQVRAIFFEVMRVIRQAYEQYARPAFTLFRQGVVAVAGVIRANWPQIAATARAVGEAIRAAFQVMRASIAAVMPIVRALAPLFKAAFAALIVAVRVGATVMRFNLQVIAGAIRAVGAVVRVLAPVFRAAFGAAAAAVRVAAAAIAAAIGPALAAIRGLIAAVGALKRAAGSVAGLGEPKKRRTTSPPGSPELPPVGHFQSGGFVSGSSSYAIPIWAHTNEVVLTPEQQDVFGGPEVFRQMFGFSGGPQSSFAAGGIVRKPKHVAPRLPERIREAELRAQGTPTLADDIAAYLSDQAWTSAELRRKDLTAGERNSLRRHLIQVRNRLKSLRARQAKAKRPKKKRATAPDTTDYTALPGWLQLQLARARATEGTADDLAALKAEESYLLGVLLHNRHMSDAQKAAVIDALTNVRADIKTIQDTSVTTPDTSPDLQARLDQAIAQARSANLAAGLANAFVATGVFAGSTPAGGTNVTFQSLFPPTPEQARQAAAAAAEGASYGGYRIASSEKIGV